MTEQGGASDTTMRVWAIFRKGRQVLGISDAEVVLVTLAQGVPGLAGPPSSPPDWLPETTALLPETGGRPSLEDFVKAGEVSARIPRAELRFAEISGSVLMLQGQIDIPYVLDPEEESVAEAVVERLVGQRVEYSLADVAKDIGRWNVGMLAVGGVALLVPVFEAPWGVMVLIATALGLAARRPVCYLTYAVLCFGGALSSTAGHLRGGPGAWVIAVLVMGFLGLVTLRRWIHLRHARTTGQPYDARSEEVPGWQAPAAMCAALVGVVLLAVALCWPERVEQMGTRFRIVSPERDVSALPSAGARLPGHLGLLALGLALGSLGSARRRPWALAAIFLAVLLVSSLAALNLVHRMGTRFRIVSPGSERVSMAAPLSPRAAG